MSNYFFHSGGGPRISRRLQTVYDGVASPPGSECLSIDERHTRINPMKLLKSWPVALVFPCVSAASALGQTSQDDTKPKPQTPPPPSLEKKFLATVLSDQLAISTAPFSLPRGAS